jgi:TldD protein
MRRRLFASSEGAYVETDVRMVGFAHSAIASAYGILEYVSDSRSQCAGFEFISGADWSDFARKVAETSIKAVKAPSLKPGKYTVVADQDLVGLILHEALGHAAEGDLVSAGESILAGKVGHIVGSKFVTIIDEGVVNGGYYLPYDDEGTEKGRCIVVEGGILKGYLHSRLTANKLGERPTGNARSQDFGHFPMVRQTNFYMDRGDACLEELLDGIKEGIYLRGTGARGGQVDVGQGTFTLRAGPSYIIRGGELSEMVRGVSVSGMVLEALKRVSAVGRDLLVKTSIFGGCGKGEQRVLVGYGGPHVRVEQMSVGSGL